MISFDGISDEELLRVHNECAEIIGSKPVAAFANRAEAEKNTRFRLSIISEDKRPEPFRKEIATIEGAKKTRPGELDFGERSGSKREKLINVMLERRGTDVPLPVLVAAVYGHEADPVEMKGPLAMVFKGMGKMIAAKKLPIKIVKKKEGKDITYGLYDA
jgi:hypothetical protein